MIVELVEFENLENKELGADFLPSQWQSWVWSLDVLTPSYIFIPLQHSSFVCTAIWNLYEMSYNLKEDCAISEELWFTRKDVRG